MQMLSRQHQGGNFFLDNSKRQHDRWLGQLGVSGRVNQSAYRADPSLRNLVDVVAYGLRETPPSHASSVVKGNLPGTQAAPLGEGGLSS